MENHGEEWGVPVHEDRKHFEMLILEGAQAGLSWKTVLRKREAYRTAFKGFKPKKFACMTDHELEELLQNQGTIRNRLKIFTTRKNAIVFLDIQKEFGSFDAYISMRIFGALPVENRWMANARRRRMFRQQQRRAGQSLKILKRGYTFS